MLRNTFGAHVELVKGDGGVFDVVVDGERIFSKHETGRFPDPQEIVDRLRAGSSAQR